ncbi:hypothetical protein F4677DRAFT_449030 [Hypoxylon crocopeplum]|nr:hypothetical protein F4677DRAFT_449030 [Hypoxylon crocopeplum]
MVKNVDLVTTLEASDVNGNILVLVTFKDALTSPTIAENTTPRQLGQSVRTNINKELNDIADIVTDCGLLKWWVHGRSSTLLNFSGPSVEVVRIGACYDVIRGVLNCRWNIELPFDPGMESLRFGHLKNPDPTKA